MMLEEIATYLESHGQGTKAEDIFVAHMPDGPDAAVALYQYSGRQPEYMLTDGSPEADMPGLQVVTRANTFAAAATKIETIRHLLSGLGNVTLSGTTYHSIFALQSPFPLGIDDKQRFRMAVNFAVMRQY